MESTLKSCQVFFCLHFFIFLWLMETSQMPVSDRLIFFFLNSFQMKDKSTYAFGENKNVTWSYCWSVLCHVMNMHCSQESSQQQSAAKILFFWHLRKRLFRRDQIIEIKVSWSVDPPLWLNISTTVGWIVYVVDIFLGFSAMFEQLETIMKPRRDIHTEQFLMTLAIPWLFI